MLNTVKRLKIENNHHVRHYSQHRRRVVVTGLGLVTPLGVGVEHNWKRLIEGYCGITSIDRLVKENLPSTIGGIVRRGKEDGEFDSERWVPKDSRGLSSPFIEYAICAAQQAVDASRWKPKTEEDSDRTGVTFGSSLSSLDDILSTHDQYSKHGLRKVSPYFIPRILNNLAGGHISIIHGYRGPNHCASTACTTGAHSIGDAFRFISHGDADVMIAGGSESCITPLAVAGFSRARALATEFNENPTVASRPFDRDRRGFIMSEGAGAIMLEELHHAIDRGADIYCEVLGYGLSGDGHHVTSPPPDGRGAEKCMRAALRDANATASQVDYVNAHATSTPLGDAIENAAIMRVFHENTKLSVSSTKGATGHLLGAAGAVEAIFSILAIRHNVVPPTLNLENVDEGFNLDYTPKTAKKRQVDVSISNSFGFGD
ncbi:hypothetical protein PROFUN_06769 [Planoprotostelium fungivorum]|uniref:3-oxoacyl-[acyl-carrier-protein] synthase n=1 Tax=Planoprotostelium fungivorum TaxID=1890364 RepID=A0A2P6NNK4_9EUKA|nr:hypothetical protein PROFUN_06769 [Planoprotostelium fungivorum]